MSWSTEREPCSASGSLRQNPSGELRVYERAGRTITPSTIAWHRSGDLLAEMARGEGLEVGRVSKAFANDVLLALSCRESGCVLVTDNLRDFRRIRRFLDFEFVPPWPGMA